MFRKLIFSSAVALAVLPGTSWSLGLGGIRAQSALNQPFSGEIELFEVQPDELDTVKVRLASEAEFEQAGTARPGFLSQLRFSALVSPSGRAVVRVDSTEPIREPYLDFLIEVIWPDGRMVKGYTVLLDPPVTFGPSAPPRSALPRVAARPAGVPLDASAFPLRYGPVPAGMGLWRVARALQPPGATVAQTAMALYRSNQPAFIRGDINKLRRGAELQIPTPEELFALDARAAQSEFGSALRGRRVTATPLTDGYRRAPAADRLEIAVAPAPAPVSPAPLPVQSPTRMAGGGEPQPDAIERDLLLVQESAESTRQETLELRARVQELEAQLADIQTLLELRNEQLAQLQASGAETPVEPPAAELADRPSRPGPLPLEEGAATEVEEPGVAEPGTEEEVVAAAPEAAEPPVARPEMAEEEPAGAEAVAEAPPQPPGVSDEAPPAETAVAPAEEGAPAKPFWQEVAPSTLGLAVGVPVVLVLAGLLAARRRKAAEEALPPARPPAAEEAPKPRKPAVSDLGLGAGGTARDAKGINVSPGVAAPTSGLGELDRETDEEDIVSEADVYIAYGRYREAESLLSEEIKASPERADLKFKLAEAYHGAKNAAGLDGLMSELRGMGADRSHPEQWQRLLLMSAELAGSGPPSVEAPSLSLPTASRGPAESGFETAAMDWSVSQEASQAGDELRLSGFADGGPDSERLAPGGDLELERGDFELLAPGQEPTGEEGAAGAKTRGPEIPLGELEGAGLAETSEPRRAPPVAGGQATGGPESLGGASLDSLDITPTGKDSAASDVLSSQWQMDSGFWDEVATKIDLARAYMEMEDPEAARVILEEVVAEGTEEQKSEAREMLSRLT